MSKLPRDLPGDRLIRALGRIGWYVDHQVGSHATLRNSALQEKKLVVPVHPGRPLKPKTLQRIIKEAGVTVEQLRELL